MTSNVYLPPSPHQRYLYNAIDPNNQPARYITNRLIPSGTIVSVLYHDPALNAEIKTTLLITTLSINPN